MFEVIREATKECFTEGNMHSKENSTQNVCVEIENMAKQMYEVMYIGKVTVSDSKAPPSFIDEAVKKFLDFEKRKISIRKENWIESRSGSSLSSSTGSIEKANNPKGNSQRKSTSSMEAVNTSNDSNLSFSSESSDCASCSEGNLSALSSSPDDASFSRRKDSGQKIWDDAMLRKASLVSMSNDSLDDENNVTSLKHTEESQDNSTKSENRNRTMLIGVGKRSLTLISPDRKSAILERNFKDISFCAQVINLYVMYF